MALIIFEKRLPSNIVPFKLNIFLSSGALKNPLVVSKCTMDIYESVWKETCFSSHSWSNYIKRGRVQWPNFRGSSFQQWIFQDFHVQPMLNLQYDLAEGLVFQNKIPIWAILSWFQRYNPKRYNVALWDFN